MPGGDHCAYSAVGMAMTAVVSEPVVRDRLSSDPAVQILVVNAERSTTKCRIQEQYPMTVKDRGTSPLVKRLETSWTICDLEDVVTQKSDRTLFPELEPCKLRSDKGIYGQKGDDIHFRKDIAVRAGDELIKACHRTAALRYGDNLGSGHMLLILAAGWNSNGSSYSSLSRDGKAWRKAEIVALAELCALNGHPFSAVQAKMTELLARADEDHHGFLPRIVEGIKSIPAPFQSAHEACRDTISHCPGHLEGWVQGRRWASICTQNDPQLDRNLKRKREAEILANEMCLPVDTAESILESAGSLDVARDLPIFQESSRRRLGGQLNSSSSPNQVIEIDEHDEHVQEFDLVVSDEYQQNLLEMGFTPEQAQAALQRTRGDFAEAVELLLVN